jgi:3-polyprenyl-4-hydroxybenzoate decarboxylase
MYAGHASQVMALAAQCTAGAYFGKYVIVVDDDIDPSNVGQVPGTGLGLTIVRRVVDYHRGTVALTSVVGEGTTFKLSFPREFSADRAAGPTTTALPLSKLQPIKPSSP